MPTHSCREFSGGLEAVNIVVDQHPVFQLQLRFHARQQVDLFGQQSGQSVAAEARINWIMERNQRSKPKQGIHAQESVGNALGIHAIAAALQAQFNSGDAGRV